MDPDGAKGERQTKMTGESKFSETAGAVRGLLLRHLPSYWSAEELNDDLALMGPDLGLDSVEVVELLLDCEALFGLCLPAKLAIGEPLTIRKIAAHILYGATETPD